MAGPRCLSFSSIASTVLLMASTEMPAMSSGEILLSSIALLTAATRDDHHSSGSCSAQPGRGCKRVYSRSLKTSGVPSGSKMPTLAPPVPKSMPRRYGPSVITMLLSRAWRIAAGLSLILPAELIPQIARDELIYPLQGVVRQVLYRLPGQVPFGSLASQDDGRRHPRAFRHPDLRVEAIAAHHTFFRIGPDQVDYRLQHYRVRLADVDLALGSRTRLYGRDDRGRVRLAPATGERTVTIGVGGDEHRPFVEPDGVEGDLELAVVEPAVVAGDDYVDLLGVLGHPDPGLRERVLERLLAYGEDRCFWAVREQPAGHRDDGIYYLGCWCLQAKLAELLGVHPWVFRGVVGEEDNTFAELAQLEDQTLRAGEQLVSQVDGPVEIEDVALVQPVRRLRPAGGPGFATLNHVTSSTLAQRLGNPSPPSYRHGPSETVAAPTHIPGGPGLRPRDIPSSSNRARHPWRGCFSNVDSGANLLYHVGWRRPAWNGTSLTGTRRRGCATLPPRGRRCCYAPMACSPTHCPGCSRASRRRTWSAWLPMTSTSPVKVSCGYCQKTAQSSSST